MERKHVASSVIRSLGYEPASRALDVEFHTGRIYQYHRVPAREFHALTTAPSIGSYFNRHIRERYPAIEITPDPPQNPPWRTPRKRRK
jgi:hypothetical protein